MPFAGRRLSPILLLLAASLGTSALIEACFDGFGLDGDPVHFARPEALAALALLCAIGVLGVVLKSCTRCENGRYRDHIRRELIARLPCGGRGVRFTAIVALVQLVCTAFIQISDSVQNPREDLIGWATSLLLVLLGTIVVRFVLRMVPRLAPLVAVFFVKLAQPPQSRLFIRCLRCRPIAGCICWPRVMFMRPPPLRPARIARLR